MSINEWAIDVHQLAIEKGWRGLLCNSCNCAVDFLNDDPARAIKLIIYLRRN